MSKKIGLSWGSLGEGFLMLDSSGKIFVSRTVTSDDRESFAILTKSISSEVDATLETRKETVIQVGGDSEFCRTTNAFYVSDLAKDGIDAEAPELNEYFAPSDHDPQPRHCEHPDVDSEIIPLFVVHDNKGIAHLMLDYTKERNEKARCITITFEVMQIYTSPSYEGKAFDLDLHIAAGYVIESIIYANMTDLPDGFYLAIKQVKEIGPLEQWSNQLNDLTSQDRDHFLEMMGTSFRWIEMDCVIDNKIEEVLFNIEEDSSGMHKHIHRIENDDDAWIVGGVATVHFLQNCPRDVAVTLH